MYLLDTNVVSELRQPKAHGAVLAWMAEQQSAVLDKGEPNALRLRPVALLRQALQRDPAFARAHSRLAALHVVWSNTSSADRYASLIAEAIRQAEQALRLNPGLAEPHAVLGLVHQNARRYGEARAIVALGWRSGASAAHDRACTRSGSESGGGIRDAG